MRDPRPKIGIVICPLFPFWHTGRPVCRRPSSHFPFCLISRFPPCVLARSTGGGRLVILARMVTYAVTSMPKTGKMRIRSAASLDSY